MIKIKNVILWMIAVIFLMKRLIFRRSLFEVLRKDWCIFFEPNFSKLISLKETLEKINVKPATFYIENTGDIKVFLSSTTTELGPEIIF